MSKLPIVTSKFRLSIFTQISLLLNESNFLECMIVLAKLMIFVNPTKAGFFEGSFFWGEGKDEHDLALFIFQEGLI